MNKTPLVSMGLPLYNGEDYLAATLDTLLAQTYENFELIIVDNASTDGSIAICQEYMARDSRIQLHQNEKNLGAARNYNLAFEFSKGRYFKWVAHDDPMEPTAIERCVTVLESDPDVIMAYPRTILIDGVGDVIEYHDDQFHLMMAEPHLRLRQSMVSSAWCHPVFGLVRTEVLARTGLIGNFPSSDKVLLGEFALQGKCYEVGEHLAYRRLHEKNSTESNTTDEAMAAWFDPSARRTVTTPRLRRLIELNRGIGRANLSLMDALRCRAELARFYLSLGRVQGALRDGQQLLRRTLTGRASAV